ncbi:Domain of unknown function (DUF1995) [Seminavis robusta]|uniref:DUF1995 domain-containing protein n=1 Tax=Seminavis robusta TaxID=568900 RepID=A0A9N8EK88_9STRA|nr:Domain of unknown function (DUF1995) [Seminavis robusta]|eukprot:Sro1323_g262720.1 Domain of unknown function (DUF1995) (294) ;mRNA; f:26487-27368
MMTAILARTGTFVMVAILLEQAKCVTSLASSVPPVFLPTSQSAMIKQAASAIQTALLDDKIHLQTIRLPLSEAMYSESEEGFVADRAIGWQGGPQETYRYLSPLVRQLLQSVDTLGGGSNAAVLPRIQEQVMLDFDGSALMTSESPAGPLGDAQALIQPNTDAYYYPKTIPTIESQMVVQSNGTTVSRLFLLVNPAWRDVSSFGFLAPKEKVQRDLLDTYPTTYAVDQFVVRGQKCSLLKVWPHDWCVFVSNLPYDNDNNGDKSLATFLGSFEERPPYNVMDELILAALQKKN